MEQDDIRGAGLKVTVPRVRILELLGKPNAGHLTAEIIYQQLRATDDSVGLATIYRVLLDFERAGLVVRHQFEDGHAVFELNRGLHHDHMVCLACGRIVEFVDETIERRQKVIAEQAGFEIRHHALILYGVCDNPMCRKAKVDLRMG
jgi:Fur family ferric uptake transcriptional regulator